jgi:hypothetical protein
MFIRRNRKRLASGDHRTYVSLAHNVREKLPDGRSRPKPIIFARLGREDDLDANTVVQMRDALDRYLRQRFGDEVADANALEDAAADVAPRVPGMRVLASKAYGMRAVVEPIYASLGLKRALSAIEDAHNVQFPFERLVFGMILNRLVDPASKRACNEWLGNEAWFPEGEGCDVHHFYRALDLIEEHADDVLDAVGRAARESCSTDELAMLLIDTTTSYMESEYDDAERKQIHEEWVAHRNGEADRPTAPVPQVVNDPPFRMRGHSKDHRPREPQVKLGLVTTPEGRPVDLQLEPGNLSDQRMTLQLLETAGARMSGRRLVAVMDSGMGGNPNLMAIDRLEPSIDRVSAVPFRKSKVAEAHLLSRPGRWRAHPYRNDFTFRDAVLDADVSPSGRRERWVATRNEVEARRQRRLLDKEVERVKDALAQDARVDGHGRPVCKLLSNRKRYRLVRKNKRGDRFILNRDRIRLERRRAGVHVLRSTLVDEPVSATLRAYDAQYGIEADFRRLKSPLRLRPMHHRATRRIHAHVLMCGLALMVMRELERRAGVPLSTVQRVVGRARAMQVRQGRTVFWQREEWSDEAKALLKTLGVSEGPRTWGAKRVVDT